MNRRKAPLSPAPAPVEAGDPAVHRSGAVAQMLRMPVATLRVWERRYGLSQPALSPSGQRLYSADDVRRLALIKQLTDLGHAIGSLATLDMAQLQRVAATRTHAVATTARATEKKVADAAAAPALPSRVWRLAVIGTTLGQRLQRHALWRRLGPRVMLLGPFGDAAQADAALRGSAPDALLIHEPQLHPGWLAAFAAAAPALAAVPRALLYSFAPEAVCDTVAATGTALLREPQPDAVLAQWLRSLRLAAPAPQPEAKPNLAATETAPPRRWGDAALADFAQRSSTMACECPRHVAELLLQLSHFESYSAECENRNAQDAELHAHLRQVAATSRTRFEAALEYVALHEGLMLPSPTLPSHP